jgi:DNA repair exonuclease SbcCD ATPase subunit
LEKKMKPAIQTLLSMFVLASVILACGAQAPVTASPDAVNTAIAQTQQAEALAQATVNASALTSIPSTMAAVPATPTPGPAVEYVTLTEEELAALIDQAVAEAVAATEQTSAAVTSSTADDAVTAEEVAYVYEYYYYADYYVEYAEELMAEYYGLYSDLATDMIAELNAIESELNQMNETLASIDSSLQEINTTLQQGLAVAEESIAQLEAAAQQAQTKAQDAKAQAQDMISVLQAEQQARVDQLSQIQANSIPEDKIAALQSAFEFIDFANTAMGDNKLSRDELTNLTQLGKNTQAGFQQFGGVGGGGGLGAGRADVDLTQFSGKFDEITTQFARGQMPQARGNVSQFEGSLGTRPNRPKRGG